VEAARAGEGMIEAHGLNLQPVAYGVAQLTDWVTDVPYWLQTSLFVLALPSLLTLLAVPVQRRALATSVEVGGLNRPNADAWRSVSPAAVACGDDGGHGGAECDGPDQRTGADRAREQGPGEAGEEHERADAEDRAGGGVAAVGLLGRDAHAAQCAP
jgi:hypothetical protein